MKKLPIDNMGMMKDMLSRPTGEHQMPDGTMMADSEMGGENDIAEGSRISLDPSVVPNIGSLSEGSEIGLLIKGTVATVSETGVEVDISSVEVSGAKKEEPKGERPSLSIMLGGGLTK